MKKMTCKQLGGACDLVFEANTFDEMAVLSKQHGTEMHQQNEPAHMKAMSEMMELMKSPDAMNKWFTEKREEFDKL
ncbi:DUF1059 domain-containing protein [Flavobacteriales bacterium]|nr:DUF1059 domain-containing protein [Flavobacteriales bacterium]